MLILTLTAEKNQVGGLAPKKLKSGPHQEVNSKSF
jgi:hypothetical protein